MRVSVPDPALVQIYSSTTMNFVLRLRRVLDDCLDRENIGYAQMDHRGHSTHGALRLCGAAQHWFTDCKE
jgi:hypothetical protein